MKMWLQWVLCLLSWIITSVSINLWPQVNELELGYKADLMAAILFQPFHYLTSFLFLLFFIMMAAHIYRKVIYECRVAFLFRKIPYEALLLFVSISMIYIRTAFSFFYLLVTLSLIAAVYEWLSYLPKRKEEIVMVESDQ